MGFFLLGRGREHGDLRLIATEEFSDRQSALDALSQLSSDPDFAHRDADVFVLDLDAGMPVLLVAPAAPAVPQDLPVEEPADEPEAPAAGVWEAPEPEPAEEPVLTVDEPIAEAVVATAKAEPEGDLVDSLRRAAGSLESEGITPPESVAAIPEPVETAIPEPVIPMAPASVEAPEAALPPQTPEPALPPEPIEPELPVEEPAVEEVVEDVAPVETTAESEVPVAPAAEAGWPWEAPSVSVDEEAEFAPPKPVIMGAYADEVDASGESDTESDEDLDTMLADLEPIETVEAVGAEVVADTAVAEPASERDPVPEEAPAKEESSANTDADDAQNVADLTCDDCVYVNTCPNKEDLEPSSCGTFQWKSI